MENNQDKDILLDYMFSVGFEKTEYCDIFRLRNENKGIVVEANYDDEEQCFVDGLTAYEEWRDDTRFCIAYLHYIDSIEDIKAFFKLIGISL